MIVARALIPLVGREAGREAGHESGFTGSAVLAALHGRRGLDNARTANFPVVCAAGSSVAFRPNGKYLNETFHRSESPVFNQTANFEKGTP